MHRAALLAGPMVALWRRRVLASEPDRLPELPRNQRIKCERLQRAAPHHGSQRTSAIRTLHSRSLKNQ
jgi:hypothetical protein